MRPTPRPESPSTMPRMRPMSVKNARFLEAEATGVRPRLRPESPRTRPRPIGFGLKTEARHRGLT